MRYIVVWTLTALLVGFAAGAYLESYERDKTALSPHDNARDLCVELAMDLKWPVLYVENRGCVVLLGVTKRERKRRIPM